MNKQQSSSIDKSKLQSRKISTNKQQKHTNNNNNNNKPIEKSHNKLKYVLQPITTVSGQKKFKQYQKIKKIGKGTYSQCFLVKTIGSDSHYALKIIPKNKLQVLIRQKLIYQIKIQQQLSHPHVVYLDHWFQDQQFQYIFMEYCSNGNLQFKLQQLVQFSQSKIKIYAKQIIQSLIYIHSKGILHRDLKMCNFYLDQNDNIKLGDFGFACQLNHLNQLKRQTCGTPNYIAPQAISGFGYSFSADVWAVGVILYRMKFSCCPFQGASVKNTLQNVKLCRYIFPKGQKISAQLKDLITKIFNINYDQRLSLQQIYNHPFFINVSLNSNNNIFSQKKQELTKQKRGFSLSRLFSSSKQKTAKQGSKLSPKGSKVPVRSNSCETFKKIKQTFKQKSLNTLHSINTMNTQQNVYLGAKTQIYTTLSSMTNRQNGGSKNVRDIIDSFNNTIGGNNINDFNNKNNDRNSRLTQFLAKQHTINKAVNLIVKQKPLKGSEPFLSSVNNVMKKSLGSSLFDQLLINVQKKYILAQSYTNYNDITIVSFPQNIKLLIYSKNINVSQQKLKSQNTLITSRYQQNANSSNIQSEVIVLYKNKYSAYNLNGDKLQLQTLSKVLNYVIDKKIVFDQIIETQEFNISQPTFQTIIQKLPNQILHKKQGILMIYGTKIKGYFIAKSFPQDIQYLASLQKKLNTLFKYNNKKNKFEVQDGPVIAKIYQGWTQQLLSTYYQK